MTTRQRTRQPDDASNPADTPDATRQRAERWEAANRLAAEGDAAVDQCLSEDSETYLRSRHQRGGQ